MKTNDHRFEQFEALLAQKKYTDLSETEKKLVETFCDSPKEYALMQQMVLATPPHLAADSSVPPALISKLAANKQPSFLQRFMQIKVPLWAFMMALLSLLFAVYWFRPSKVVIKEVIKQVPQEIIKEVPKEIVKTDTVVQYAYRTDTVYLRNNERPHKSTQSPVLRKPSSVTVMNPSAKKEYHSPQGRSIKKDPELRRFMTDISPGQ